MPSTEPLAAIPDFLTAASNALTGERDQYGDGRRGSVYDRLSGPMAVLLAREAQNDKDNFADIYIDDAEGKSLTRAIQGRWGIARVLDTYGTGTCLFERSSDAAGAGPLLAGSRIQLQGDTPAEYVIAQDYEAQPSDTLVSVAIRASVTGAGVAANVVTELALEDAQYDPLWQPVALTCADGTSFEKAQDYRARARALRLDNRNGYLTKLQSACIAGGATYAFGFPSSYGLQPTDFADDDGLSAIYVADANFQGTKALAAACAAQLEACRVLGADIWCGYVVPTPLSIVATVYLVDDPAKLNLVVIKRAVVQAIITYFSQVDAGYTYKLDALGGAMRRSSPSVQSVAFTTPSSDHTISAAQWPASLPRFTVAPRNITLTFSAPI